VRAARRHARLWAWLRKWAKRAKLVAEIAGLVGAMCGAAAKAWLLMHARSVGRADVQVGGSERMAADRVDEPPQAGK